MKTSPLIVARLFIAIILLALPVAASPTEESEIVPSHKYPVKSDELVPYFLRKHHLRLDDIRRNLQRLELEATKEAMHTGNVILEEELESRKILAEDRRGELQGLQGSWSKERQDREEKRMFLVCEILRCQMETLVLDYRANMIKKHRDYTGVIPDRYAGEKDVCLVVESESTHSGWHAFSIRLLNPSDLPLTFHGYSEQSPLYSVQRWIKGKWVDKIRGVCGTGLRQCTIPRLQASIFSANVKEEMLPARFGVRYAQGEEEGQIIWTQTLDKGASNTSLHGSTDSRASASPSAP
jgi:hypothetical protein